MPRKPLTLPRLKVKAWALLSEILRKQAGKCCMCDQQKDYKKLQTHHVIPKCRSLSIYFNEENLLVMCYGCHHFKVHGRMTADELLAFYYKKIGEDLYNDLYQLAKQPMKISRSEYEEMIEGYKKRLRDSDNML